MPQQRVGSVQELWRFPIKSMAGERLEDARFTGDGVLGDRSLALLDVDAGAIVSASNRHFPALLNWRAAYIDQPTAGTVPPAMVITAPSGQQWTTDDPSVDASLSQYFGRRVSLVRTPPAAWTARQAEFFAAAGLSATAPMNALVDLYPVSVITSATCDAFARLAPQSRFDGRRFRMNLSVAAEGEGFVENAWVGHDLLIGPEVRLRIVVADPRCSMTTMEQGDLPHDPAILRTIVRANSLPIGTAGTLPCAGVYASVVTPGTLRIGDPVALVPSAQAPDRRLE